MKPPFQVGDRIRVVQSARHYLIGLEGTVIGIRPWGLVAELESDPQAASRYLSPNNTPPPRQTGIPRRVFQFCEVEKL